MDRTKLGRRRNSGRVERRPVSTRPARPQPTPESSRQSGEDYWLVRSLGKLASKRKLKAWDRFRQTEFGHWPDKHWRNRVYAFSVFMLFSFSTIAGIVQPFIDDTFYGVTPAVRAVLPDPKASLGAYLAFDAKEQQFTYNAGYNGAGTDALAKVGQGEPRISATFAKEPSEGMSVSDALNKVDFKLKPTFKLNIGKQDNNQIFYPLVGQPGYLVYTAQTASIKEDIVLEEAGEDTASFEYELELGNNLEARLEQNGTVGIYGSSLPISGQVATGSEKDAALLEKVRTNTEKDKLMFVIPAPVVVEASGQSSVTAFFELKGNKLVVVAQNLKQASYPLSIDPSVYVESAVQLMRGNNETNVEFDIATEQFKKGTTTGARIDSWNDTMDGPAGIWGQSTAAAGGYVYSVGGRTSRIQPRILGQKITTQSTASTSYVISMPDIRPSGDLYVAVIADAVNAAADDVTPPAGWTQVADTRAASVFYRIGSGTEPATYTWTGPTSQYSAVIVRIKDFDAASVLTGTAVVTNGTNTTPSYNTATPTDNGGLQLSAASFTNVLAPSSYATSAIYYGVASATSSTTASTATAGFVLQTSEVPIESGVASGGATFSSIGTASGWGGVNLFIKGSAIPQAVSNAVYWAKFNSANGSVESPAPGSNGTACSGWCTNAAYNLPVVSSTASDGAGLIGSSLVAYNGYLYLVGGSDGTSPIKSTIYAAKIGANGEPQLWHPSDPDQANWVYWHKIGGAYDPVMYSSVTAYNGRLYVLGGDNNFTERSGAISTTKVADILPNGTLGTFATSTALPNITKFASVQVYNGYIYLLGGSANGGLYNDGVGGGTGQVIFSKIQPDGTLGTWKYAAADGSQLGFKTPRMSLGGTMSGVSGGYIYLAGGCTAYSGTTNDYCDPASVAGDVQLASINADGTLDSWNTMLGLRNYRFGYSFVAWQDSLYRFGGCSRMSTSTGDCWATHRGVQYGNINQDGDASTVSISTTTGTGNCQGTEPYDCNLPPGGTGSGQSGQALTATVILNGYLYVIGGCTTNACTTMSSNVSYAAIDSTGKLKNPPFCPGGEFGAWCVDNTNQVNSGNGLGATAATVFNNTIYIVGGQNGSGAVGNIQRNTVNPDGSFVGAWSAAQTLTSVGAQSVSYTYVYARANPTSVATNPGNLYIFGGCTAPATGAGCTAGNSYSQNVYKCNITATGTVSGCTTTGQQTIGTVSGALNPGLGIHAGTVFANYIYLIGGVADGQSDLKTVRYARFDNNNNVVGVSGASWTVSSVEMNNGRRRGAAFGYNGYLYSVGGYDASTSQSLDSIEFAKINVSDGSLVSNNNLFKKSAVTINQRWGLSLAVSNSYAYVIGGCKLGVSPTCDAGGLDNTVQTFQIYNNNSGAPAGYTAEPDQFSTQRQSASAAIHNGYIYVAGGCTSGTDICTATTDSVEFAPVDSYGNIGTWSATTDGTLPAGRSDGQLEVVGGTLYWIGGQDNSGVASTDIYYGTPSANTGNVTSWNTVSTGALPSSQGRSRFSATVWNNRIYVLGGYTGNLNSSPTRLNTIVMSPNLSSGGDITAAWTSGGTSFNVARTGHIAVAYANNLYIMGGDNGTNYFSDVQFAKLDSSTGQAGSWTYTTSLPSPITQADGFAVNGYMYIMGGRKSVNDCSPRTLIAPISANTSIASGNNPTGIGEWYQTNRNYNGGRFGNSSVYANGKAYVIGGGCQGVVMQDDFDSNVDPTMWRTTTGMNVGTTCQSTSSSNVLYTTSGGQSGPSTGEYYTKEIAVPNGGTIYFKFYSPPSDGGGCFAREQDAAILFGTSNPDDVVMKYSTTAGGGTGTFTNFTGTGTGWNCACSPMKNFAITIPPGAFSNNTTISWWMPTGEANDSYALEDVYIVANGSGTVAAPSSAIEVTSLLSQPQVAHYTRLIDAGKDVFPTKWLMNGIDNSIGARWQMKYRSMNDSTVTDSSKACSGSVMSTFGQLTNFGDVTLGNPETYTVKDSSGTDIKCSRYFFMDISIDASRTYGYPDDISRGPTLDNLTLFFKSNPGSRLLHGKTFIEGSQQPLDTQPGL